MSGFSDTVKAEILEALFHGTAFQGPEEMFIALVTTAVVGADTGATIKEATYAGYKRVGIKKADWAAVAENAKANSTTKVFAECTGGESAVIGWALCTEEATASGLVICSGRVQPTVITSGVTPEFLAGALAFRISDS
jgi:hypothetical protein